MSHILIINPGSTAVKYSLFSKAGERVETWQYSRKDGKGISDEERIRLESLRDIERIGIRIVHGNTLTKPALFNARVREEIRAGALYAPTHNALALAILSLLEDALPGMPVVCVFDTEFHSALPEHARTYPIPLRLSQQHNLFRCGFHGLALESVFTQLNNHLKKNKEPIPQKVILAHLGGGSSITAVHNGASVDTTMGLTPLEGIMMITRSGSIDPELPRIIAKKTMQTPDVVSELLNEHSGFVGLTGSEDTLDIITRAAKGEEPYKLAFDIFVHQVVKQIYAYYGVLQGVDALVFSGGIGFGNDYFRSTVLRKLTLLGINENNTFAIEAQDDIVVYNKVVAMTL